VKSSSWSAVVGLFPSLRQIPGAWGLPLRATQATACHSSRSEESAFSVLHREKQIPRRVRDDIVGTLLVSLLKSNIRSPKLILGVAWTVMFTGCAAQGPPHPPRVQVPQRVTDLTVHQVGFSLELGFTPPALATDGEDLTKPLEVEIFRDITPPRTTPQVTGSDPKRAASSPTPVRPWVTLGARDLTGLTRGEKVVYTDRISQQQFAASVGSVFGYRVRSLTRGFRGRAVLSQTSNSATAILLDVSGPVGDLKVVTTEKSLRLEWAAPARTLTGAPVKHLAGYRVYRSEKPKLQSFRAVGDSQQTAFSDPHFEFGRTYHYKVRAVFKQGAQEAEGEDSRPYQVTPQDVFPPAPPQGLTALYTVGAVELIWNANREPDLAGYKVYRRESGKPFQPITKELLRTPLYRDSSIEPQRHYFYQITAVDLSGNESTPSTEVQADTE
jgi:hypothetical protein